jgi:hypothetical protein
MSEQYRVTNEISENKVEADVIKNYPFLAKRMEKLKLPVHYDESFLTHVDNCRQELNKMKDEFDAFSANEKEKQKFIDIVKKTLDLHEISKIVEKGEVKGITGTTNEERSGQIIIAEAKELGITDDEARIISFLVSNYHLLNELFTKKVIPEEVASKITKFSSESNVALKKLLELLRIVSNANNLSAVDIKNRNEGTHLNRGSVKKMIDDVVEKFKI